MKPSVGLALLCVGVACGARTEIAGGNSFEDASVPVVDASPPPDVVASSDVAPVDAVTCSAPQVQIGGNGAGTACKADVTWTCNGTSYRVAGFCDLPDADWPDADPVGAEGSCYVNGNQTGSFAMATCSCDPNAWIALAMQECPGSHQ